MMETHLIMEVYMKQNKLLKLKLFTQKVNCFMGVHRFERVEEYSSMVKRNSSLVSFKHVCSTCGCTQDVVESYSKWAGIQQEITDVGYIGDYHYSKLLRTALVKFNAMVGGVL